MIAVIPAAGLGTRMAEITGGGAKELLLVGGKPLLRWVIEESLEAGAEKVRVVGSPAKPALQDFVQSLAALPVEYVSQPSPAGLADAVARGFQEGEAGMVPMPDYVYGSSVTLKKLRRRIAGGCFAAVAVHEVKPEQVHQYGIADFGEDGEILRLVEKPSPDQTPSRWAVCGRVALSQAAIARLVLEPTRYSNLTDLIAEGLREGRSVFGLQLPPEAELFDCGSPPGYRAAMARFS